MKRNAFVSVLMFASLVLGVRSASAQVVITPAAGADSLASSLGISTDALVQQLTSQVNGLFQTSNVSAFLKDFQNAQSFSAKGLGVDYASEGTLVEAGATISFASNVDKAYKPSGSYTDPPISGGGGNFSLMAGLGLGLIGLDPLMVFGNWFKGTASLGQLDGDYQNWGFHGQLRLFGPSRGLSATQFLIRWGGIAITSGADYSRLALRSSQNLRSTFNLPTNAPGVMVPVTVASDGPITFSVEQTTWSVPLEITTSLRLLTLLTVYGGLGLDWQLGGGSDMNIKMSATLSGKVPGDTTTVNLGSASVAATGHVNPSAARLREIIGLQINAMLVRLFVQVNVTGDSPLLTSVAAGLRLAL
jgi:hypothetical protein